MAGMRDERLARRQRMRHTRKSEKNPLSPLEHRIKLTYIPKMLSQPTPLAEAVASLRIATQATEAQGNCGRIHALILAILTRLFTRLEHLIQLWQSGQLPTPQPRKKAASKKIYRETAIRREAALRKAASVAPYRRLHVNPAFAGQEPTAPPVRAIRVRFRRPRGMMPVPRPHGAPIGIAPDTPHIVPLRPNPARAPPPSFFDPSHPAPQPRL
jgi:hypothetical protein